MSYQSFIFIIFLIVASGCGEEREGQGTRPPKLVPKPTSLPATDNDSTVGHLPSAPVPIPIPPLPPGTVSLRAQSLPTETFNMSSLPSSYHTESLLTLDPKQTALMFIDVVETENPIGEERILPLLQLARRKGFMIIHAIHEFEVAKSMQPLEGEWVIRNNLENCLSVFVGNDIKNIIVVGSGTNTCVLDRPCGLIRLKLKEKLYSQEFVPRYIFVRDATLAAEAPGSWRDSYNKKMTINMMEDYVGYTTTVKDIYEAFGETFAESQIDYRSYGYEDQENRPILQNLDLSKTMLLVLNAYPHFSNEMLDRRIQDNITTVLRPLVELARSYKIPIAHVFDNGVPQGSPIGIKKDELVVQSHDELKNLLADGKISYLLFAGYTTNREMLFGNAGLFHFSFDRRLARSIHRLMVKDATVGFEFPDSLKKERAKRNAINWFESNGLSGQSGEEGLSFAISIQDLYEVLAIRPDIARVKKEHVTDDPYAYYCNHGIVMLDIFNPYEFSLNLSQETIYLNCGMEIGIYQMPPEQEVWRPKELRRVSMERVRSLVKSASELMVFPTTSPFQREQDRGFPNESY